MNERTLSTLLVSARRGHFGCVLAAFRCPTARYHAKQNTTNQQCNIERTAKDAERRRRRVRALRVRQRAQRIDLKKIARSQHFVDRLAFAFTAARAKSKAADIGRVGGSLQTGEVAGARWRRCGTLRSVAYVADLKRRRRCIGLFICGSASLSQVDELARLGVEKIGGGQRSGVVGLSRIGNEPNNRTTNGENRTGDENAVIPRSARTDRERLSRIASNGATGSRTCTRTTEFALKCTATLALAQQCQLTRRLGRKVKRNGRCDRIGKPSRNHIR